MKRIVILFGSLLLVTTGMKAQEKDKTINYRRSSLTMVLVEDNSLGKSRNMVVDAYNSHPFPDKYNLHNIADKKFSTEGMPLTKQDYMDAGFYKDTLRKLPDFLKAKKKHPFNKITNLNPEGTVGVVEPTKDELINIYINKYIKEKKIAKQIVASWYNRTPDGKMDWSLLKERALYSASADEKSGDTEQKLTDKLIKDVDVIGNTFVVFNNMEFYENEPVARFIRDAAKAETMKKLAGKPDILMQKAMKGLDDIYEKTKEGYTVKCNTYLYQLDWNEEIAKQTKALFFNNNVTNSKEIWDTTNLYKMKFVGKTVSGSIVTFKIGETRTEEQIINLQVKRTMDNAMAKLQKSYVVFRPVSPIASIDPITAQIGTKEGLEPGQTYEIIVNKPNEFGIPKWVRKGKIKVDKKLPVWDNLPGAEQKDAQGNPLPAASTFKGGKAELGIDYIRLLK